MILETGPKTILSFLATLLSLLLVAKNSTNVMNQDISMMTCRVMSSSLKVILQNVFNKFKTNRLLWHTERGILSSRCTCPGEPSARGLPVQTPAQTWQLDWSVMFRLQFWPSLEHSET